MTETTKISVTTTIMPRDKTAYAKIRNRAEKSQLQSELRRIEREKQNEMRTLDTEKKKFRTRCSKMQLLPNPREVGDGIQDTHKSSYEQKTDPSSVKVHDLVFTDGEVDAGKVLCLHLISAHRAETLTPPKKRLSYLCKEHSPTERILDKSKGGYANNEKLSSLLPLYTIEFFEMGAMGENSLVPVINDGRLAARILINANLRELIGTVINALETSNTDKLQQLVSIAQDPSELRTLLARQDILDFMDVLRNQPIVNSSESFLLTPPFKIKTRDLNVRFLPGNLESLISSIRQNVLQIPTRKSVVEPPEELSTILKPEKNSSRIERSEPTHVHSVYRASSGSAGKGTSQEQFSKKQRHRGQVFTNFIAKNIREAAKVRRIEYDVEEPEESFTKRSGTLLPKFNLAPLLTTGTGEDNTADEDLVEKKESIRQPAPDGETTEKPNLPTDNQKFRVKNFICPACMEKWRTPLPLPKTPRVKKSSVVPGAVHDTLKTDSRVRLNMLIKREIYTQESYEKRYVARNNPVKRGTVKRKVATSVVDVNFGPLDLARIEQEIREKETRKKLEKFLNKSV